MIQSRQENARNSFSTDATFAFDATYVTALALDKTLRHHGMYIILIRSENKHL